MAGELWVRHDRQCSDTDPEGVHACTVERGHAGAHVAIDPVFSSVLGAWPNLGPSDSSGKDTAWPLSMIVWRLANAVDHLLHDHDCDAHGHEGVLYALQAARRWLDGQPDVPKGEDGGSWKPGGKVCSDLMCRDCFDAGPGHEKQRRSEPRTSEAWPFVTPRVDQCAKHSTKPEPDEPCWRCEYEASFGGA